ncbi:MAG: hypothetical protein RLZZ175_2629 [Bacteroidota bacterium]|jgi:Ni,Fe-hydrogenase III small subunit
MSFIKKSLLVLGLSITSFAGYSQCDAPTINSFAPNTGFIGSTVTITGANFDPIPSNNQVFFGATKAQVISASFGKLTVIAPVGATTSLISVKNNCNKTAYSQVPFNGIFCPTPLTSTTYQNVAQELAGVYGAYNMLSQDLDLDGKPDVISATTSGITIAKNNSTPGNISFSGQNILVASSSVAVADMDGDGKRDIVVASNGNVAVVRNTSTPGNFTFAPAINFTVGGTYQIATGDFNNDGKIDIAVGSNSSIVTMLNTSSGTGVISFTNNIAIGVGYRSTGLQCADVDGDGKTDILATQGDGNRAVSLRNITNSLSNTFAFEAPEYWNSGGTYPYRCQIADFDKDGKVDLTTCNFNGATNTAIYRNTSTVGNISFATTVNLVAPVSNYRIQVGDVNGDGYPDIVTKSLGVNVFSVYPNTSTGAGVISFGSRIDYTSSRQAEVSGIVIGDLDGDFVPDLATSGISSNTIRFHRNTSSQVDNSLPTAICKNITVALSPNGTVVVTAAMIDNGSSDACGIGSLEINNQESITFTCANIGDNNVTLKVTDRSGNVSTCNAVVTVSPAAIIVAGQTTVCQGQTVPMSANLGDSYQWFKNGTAIDGATSQTYIATTTGNYQVEVSNSGGCSGISSNTLVTVNNNPVVNTTPTGSTFLCAPGNNVLLSASESSIYQWMLNGANIPNATQQTFNATTVGNYQVKVVDLFGCSATSSPIVVTNLAPEINISGSGSFGQVFPNTTTASTFVISNTGNGTLNLNNLIITGPQASNFKFTVNQNNYSLAAGTSTPITINFTGNAIGTYNASLSLNSNDCDEGQITIPLTAEITCLPVDFNVCNNNILANTDLNSCNAKIKFNTNSLGTSPINYSYSLSGTTLGNGNVSSDSLSFNTGKTFVTVVATNACGVDTCKFEVQVNDNQLPLASGKDIIVYLNANGVANISVNDIENGSSDNCSILSKELSNSVFACENNGINSVIYKVTDISGNVSFDTINVVVKDTTKPSIVNYSIPTLPKTISQLGRKSIYSNVKLNGGSNFIEVNPGASIALTGNYSASFDGGAGCNGCITQHYIGINNVFSLCHSAGGGSGNVNTTFTAPTVPGVYYITQTATWWYSCNQFGVPATSNDPNLAIAVVVVKGSTNNICASDITKNVDANKCGAIVNFGNHTANDNCSGVTLTQTSGLGNNVEYPVGVTTNTYVATDASGNTNSCSFNVTVVDNIKPVVIVKNVTLPLDANGNAILTVSDVNNGSNDACGIDSISISKSTFDCSNVGANNVVLTVVDKNGNTNSATAIVNVIDSIAPVAKVQNKTLYLNASGNASISVEDLNNGSSDACGIDSITLSKYHFDCSNVGANNVVLTVVDKNGNTNSATAIVTVIDSVAPVAKVQNKTLYLNASGNASISVEDLNNGSSDACGIDSITLSKYNFDCSNVGANNVVLTAFDKNGNTNSATAIVTVIDTIVPNVLANNLTLFLNESGNASISVSDVNNGSNDACGIDSISISKSNFDCSNVGTNNVVLTVVDKNGNTNSAIAIVNVIDTIVPNVLANNLTVYLNESGNTSISVSDVNNGSNDACGIDSISISKSNFDCSNVGANNVVLTVVDKNGNTNSATAIVTVIDSIAPVAKVQNKTLYLNASGNASISVEDLNNGSSDACGIDSITLSKYNFDCSNVGANNVVLTVVDKNGNTNSATAIVTVIDSVAPVIKLKNNTFTLVNGIVNVSGNDFNNGSTDACGIANVTVNPNTFNCTNIGLNTVTVTITDVNGNISTGNVTASIIGTIPTVSIKQSLQPEFCQGGAIILTASSNENVTYLWSTGETTNPINVYNSSNFNVTATNMYGCKASTTTTVNYVASNLLSSYNVLAENHFSLTGNSKVENGGVGIMHSGIAKINSGSTVLGPKTFVKGPNVNTTGGTVSTIINGTATVTLPTFLTHNGIYGPSNNYANGTVITITDSIFNAINVGSNSRIIFKAKNISLAHLNIGNGTTVEFASPCANLRVAGSINIGNNVTINNNKKTLAMYIGGAISIGTGSNVTSTVWAKGAFAAYGNISNTTTITGLVIANVVKGDSYVTFTSNSLCNGCTNAINTREDNSANQTVANLNLIAFPNPLSNETNINFNALSNENATIEVFDLSGNKVMTSFNDDVIAGNNYNVVVNASQLTSGLYIVRLTNGSNVSNIKLTVIK